ncbi:MAG TPA: hypothetical protein VGK24_05080 [Candidatus Angelobacter sp.]|jgi:hypothetical protein
MAYWMVNGKQLTDNEYEEYQRRQIELSGQDLDGQRLRMEEQERVRLRAEALIQKLGQAYDEVTRLLAENPEVARQVTGRATKDAEGYRQLKQRLELANVTPRCRWVKQDGTACGSPQMKKHIYCFAHKQMMEARALMLALPAPEDANAIQIGLMRVQKALIDDTISMKKAGLLLYSMQLALTNVGQTTFGQAKDEEMVRETVNEQEAISSQHSAISENQHQKQRPFTANDAEDAKEERETPLTSQPLTETRKYAGGLESEFVHAPGGYGFERVRLRIEPELGGERKLPQAVTQANTGLVGDPRDVAHEHGSEMHANLG